MLQNHPGEKPFPTSREFHPRVFNRLTTKQKTLFNGLLTLAIITLGIAIIGLGVISESIEPMPAGTIFVSVMAAVGLGAIAIIGRGLWQAAHRSVQDQKSYYALGKVPDQYPQEYRQALQLDGVNAAALWSETLEYWPTKVRLGNVRVNFQSFELDDPEQSKESLDNDWGVLTKNDYDSMVAALKAGLHCQSFLNDMLGNARNSLIARLASLTGIDQAYLQDLTSNSNAEQPPKLIWAWDLWRVIPLSRNAFMAGLITEEEAWSHVLEVSRWIHAIFEGLEDYHKNLSVGHAYWSDNFSLVQKRREVLKQFENNTPFRPIRTLAWERQSPSVLPKYVISSFQENETPANNIN